MGTKRQKWQVIQTQKVRMVQAETKKEMSRRTGANLQRDILEVDLKKGLNQNLIMGTKKTGNIRNRQNPSLITNLEIVDRGLMNLDTANIWIKIEKIVLIEIGKGIMIEGEGRKGVIGIISILHLYLPRIRKTLSYMLTISTIV